MINTTGKSLLLTAILLLAACTSGEKPRAAEVIAPAPAHEDFGDLRVHYNAMPTLAMNESIARDVGIERDAGRAMLTVALRKLVNGEELGVEGEVQAVAVDLQGMRQQISLTPVRTGEYTDYLGSFRIVERDSYRFDITVKSGGRSGKVKFQRNF
ncbi:MAG: DUF4426 domain-containing protein [Pseudoxanthomonas sp.]